MKLSKEQSRVLVYLLDNKKTCAYDVQASLNTMYALEQRKLIQRIPGEFVWFGWERTDRHFKLTLTGRELALKLADLSGEVRR